jgi:hypothetical protein
MAMMVVGAMAAVLGVAWLLSDAESPATTVPEAVSTTAAVTDGSVATVEDLLASSPTAVTTAPVTDDSVATTAEPPSTTMVMQETLEEFVAAFGGATDADDFDFLWSRIHPAVIERAGGDEELCRAWVEREILALGDYRLLEVVDGPVPFGELENVYTVAISFTFEGESFDGIGQYVAVDGRFLWLGQCR